MTKLSTILDQPARQLTIEELLAILDAEERGDAPPEAAAAVTIGADHGLVESAISPEKGLKPHSDNGLEPGASVGHRDFADFRGVYMGPGKRQGQALIKVVTGWSGELPPWPVPIPYSKLEVLR